MMNSLRHPTGYTTVESSVVLSQDAAHMCEVWMQYTALPPSTPAVFKAWVRACCNWQPSQRVTMTQVEAVLEEYLRAEFRIPHDLA
jgi:hypothetical protein